MQCFSVCRKLFNECQPVIVMVTGQHYMEMIVIASTEDESWMVDRKLDY
jgi:UDP-N-acetylglucosamine 2-epimerase